MRPNSSTTLFRRLGTLALAFLCAVTLHAQSAGSIQGRVYNPATQQYVRNAEIRVAGTDLVAYSDNDGTYVLSNVPAGEAKLTITYTGYSADPATVRVTAGQTATRDFEMKGETYLRPGATAPGKDSPIVLGQFVVSSEREGNAKAIMEQRAALNMKNVVASDNFGDVTGGNVGEFIKYLPGIVMDYTDADARAARIGGLDPKYAGVSIDGMRMASAASASFGGSTRQFEFEQASINSIEAIEVNKTLTASMDADAPAGTINMRSKNAFERKGREIVAQFTTTANTYGMTLRKTPGPDDGNHLKIFPGGTFSYADSFDGRFGVQLSLGSNTLWNQQAIYNANYDYSIPARGPILNQIILRDGPKITRRDSIGLNLDYKVSDHLMVALRTAASHFSDEFLTRTITFRANPGDIDPASTNTRVIARETANANTRVEQAISSHRGKFNDTATFTPKIEYKRGDFTITAGGGYSRSNTHYEGPNSGFFAGLNNRVTRMSWSAERSSERSTDWNFKQLSGPSWSDMRNYNRVDANPNNVIVSPQTGESQVFAGNLDLKKTVNLGLPVMFMTGIKSRLTTYALKITGAQQWTYVGAAGNQLDPSTTMLIENNYRFDAMQGGNYTSLGIPWADTTKMWDHYLAHPEYFAPNTYQNFANYFTSPRSVKEQVDAGYIEGTTRWNKLRLNLGVRTELTRTVARTFDPIPNATVRAARPDLVANTIPYLLYQYRDGERTNKYGHYRDWFLSGGLKYSVTPNLHVLLAASQSISRANYDTLAGIPAINDTTRRITLPNPNLSPETSDKYFASVQYYMEPAGTISVSAYELNVKNMGVANVAISAEEAGYADDPEYNGYEFLRATNAPGTRKIKGLDVEYSQQLVFLPGFWRGFSVFGSLSRTIPDLRVTSLVSKSANGGIRYSNHKFNVQLRSTWTAARLTSTNAQRDQWQNERIMFDVSGGYKINRTYEITLSGRNINDSPIEGYENTPGNIRAYQLYGPVWTLGVRGRF